MRTLINKRQTETIASNDNKVAQEILRQLGGMNKLSAMLGAKNFVSSDNSIQFQLPKLANKINIIKIQLETDDTYTIKFYRMKGFDTQLIKQMDRLHNNQLKSAIESNTGLHLSLSSVMKTAFEELPKENQLSYLDSHKHSVLSASKYLYDGLLDKARKQADKAKDGTLKYKGETYSFKFNKNEWNYDIYDSKDERMITIKARSLPQVKKDFIEWLEN